MLDCGMRSIGIAVLVALTACGGGDGKPGAADSQPLPPAPAPSEERAPVVPAPAAGNSGGIPFDPAALTKGVKVGALAADMLVLSRAADSTWVGSARFTGELTVSGRTIPHVDADLHEVCFEPDSAGAAGLPRWSGDTRRQWFCFSNQAEVQQSLAALHEVRPATVVIDEFTINMGRSDQVNSARLARVVTRGKPVPER